jgi:phospholipid/cholesterol/gamma-HCH transport system permease protein
MVGKFIRSTNEILAILFKTLVTCIKGPYRPKEIVQHMGLIGCGSLPIIIISTAFAGLIVTSEIAFHMNLALHTVDMIPGFSGQFIFRELGIAIPACLLVAKVGASTTAEVGTMRVTEQIDALRLLQIDPVEYLVYPRFVASVIVVACLTIIAIFVTLVCASSVAVLEYNFTVLEYLNMLSRFISSTDLVCALVKGMTFGAVIPIISCFYGFNCDSGAEGVGSATTNSVVTSTIVIIVLDFLLTFAFSLILS